MKSEITKRRSTRSQLKITWMVLSSTVFLLLALAGNGQTGLKPGVIATATDGSRKVVFVTPTANFTLGQSQSIHPGVAPLFAVEWNGFLNLTRGGSYKIIGDARIFIDGRDVTGQSAALEAGVRALRVEYKRKPGPARLQLQWESDFFKMEPIPASVLGHRTLPPEATLAATVERGRFLVEELNCIACHQAESGMLQGRRGPDLTGMGSRGMAAWIFKWLENPRHFRSSAPMPALSLDQTDRADLTAYLMSSKVPRSLPPDARPTGRLEEGKRLVENIGCQACHGKDGVALSGLGSKLTAEGIAEYVKNPLRFDPSGRMPDLMLSVEEALAVAEHLAQSRNPDFETSAPAGDALRGKNLFGTAGCANCHTLEDLTRVPRVVITAAPFKQLSRDKGCLAENPSGKAPRFSLAATEREAIGSFLQNQPVADAPIQDFHRSLTRFNCVSCHEYNGPARLEFEVNQAPPPLTDAGNKLRASWLDQVLNRQKRVRPWMTLRMPHFGDASTQPMVRLFAAQAGAELGEGEVIPAVAPQEILNAGKIIGQGEGGLSCISCHDFRGERSGGEMRGPDMTEMYARIRVDWLKRWLREPSRIQPGTAMPAFFTGMPEPQAEKMIHQIAIALSGGSSMPIPQGLSEAAQEYFLLVKDDPITFRTFIQDSSPRSIAVGLPGGQNYCFDAEFCRLRYAWVGDFLDVKPVWANRGGAQAKILGSKYYVAGDLHPLRIGDPAKVPQVKFKGYKLVNKVPEFMYEVDGVMVRELISRAETGRGIVRRFSIGEAAVDVWVLASDTTNATVTSPNGRFAEGRLRIPAGKNIQFEIVIQAK